MHAHPPIPVDVAAHVLFCFGSGGWQPGSFIAALMAAFAKADRSNRHRLGQGFPDYELAFTMATDDPTGIDQLKAVVEAARSRA